MISLSMHTLVAAYPRMLMPVVPVALWFAAIAIANHLRLATTASQVGD